MHVYFIPQGCQTLLLKESDPFHFSLGSWTISKQAKDQTHHLNKSDSLKLSEYERHLFKSKDAKLF